MIYFDDIPSFRKPEHYKIIPDERVTKIETIGGVAVQDLGHVQEGDAFSISCTFAPENWERFLALWEARQKITFTDPAGKIYQQMRIVMKEYEPDKNFPEYVTASFELWRK